MKHRSSLSVDSFNRFMLFGGLMMSHDSHMNILQGSWNPPRSRSMSFLWLQGAPRSLIGRHCSIRVQDKSCFLWVSKVVFFKCPYRDVSSSKTDIEEMSLITAYRTTTLGDMTDEFRLVPVTMSFPCDMTWYHPAISPTYQNDGLGKQMVSTRVGLWAAPC